MTAKKYYRVRTDTNYKTSDHLQHGYEKESDYRRALRILQSRFAGRVGECVDEKYGLFRLRFTDTPDGSPAEIWFPQILLVASNPVRPSADEECNRSSLLDEIFGFD